ncbi:MAG: hypothetical protein AAGF30_06865 [Pseudomonadota bacterium]
MTDPVRKDTASPPSGSARAGVEAPTDQESRNWLWIAVVAIAAILLLLWLLPGAVDAMAITPPEVPIADVEEVLEEAE